MYRLMIFVVAVLYSMTTTAQDDSKVTEKEQQEITEAAQDSIDYIKAIQALENNAFVLEAEDLVLGRGENFAVNPTINFISLSGEKTVVKIATYLSTPGSMGIGGIDLEGHASNIKTKTDKNGNTSLSMNAIGTDVSATVSITLIKQSNKAIATIRSNTTGKLTMNGYLIPFETSDIHANP